MVFEIARDGTLRRVSIEKSSGGPSYDEAALRAITDVAPFPPLPDEFKEPFLRVHQGFTDSLARRLAVPAEKRGGVVVHHFLTPVRESERAR